jgi:hypothetical protein
MCNKELLMKQIEKEREKLDSLLAGGADMETAYHQSRALDALIEQYMDCR